MKVKNKTSYFSKVVRKNLSFSWYTGKFFLLKKYIEVMTIDLYQFQRCEGPLPSATSRIKAECTVEMSHFVLLEME